MNNEDFNFFSNFPESTKEEVLNPSSNLIGQAFRGIAHFVLDPLVKYNIVKDAEMHDFTDKVKNKTETIPVENRDDSKIGLVYKAMEDSAYQLDEETLRDMFSNLISSTVDNRKNNNIKPLFSTILKDLTSTDAQVFELIYKENGMPMVAIRLDNKETGYGITVNANTLLYKDSFISKRTSLETLSHFGLIKMETDTRFASANQQYKDFTESELYMSFQSKIPYTTSEDIELDSIRLVKGSVHLTDLGKTFANLVIVD